MMHLLADLPPPDKEFVWQAALFVSAAINVAAGYMAIFGRRKVDVSMEERFATVETTDKLAAEIKRVEAERRASVARCYEETREQIAALRSDIKDWQKDQGEEMRGLNKRFTELLQGLARLEGQHDGR